MLPSNDQDEKLIKSARARARARNEKIYKGMPPCPGICGGALARLSTFPAKPNLDKADRRVAVPGRYVPVGFARYVSPTVNQLDYTYYRIAGGWRVAMPKRVPMYARVPLLAKIYKFGPESAGFARVGDTLVPALLWPGDRMTLAQSAIGAEAYPLSL